MASLMQRLVHGFKAAVSGPTEAEETTQRAYAGFLSAGFGGDVTPQVAWKLYKGVGTFAKVVDLIADQVASLEPIVKIGGDPVDGHEAIEFLKRPGFNRTRRQFIKELTVQHLVTGTGLVHALGNVNHRPLALDVFQTRHMTHIEGQDGWPDKYIVTEPRRAFNFTREGTRDVRYIDGNLGELITLYDLSGDRKGIGMPRLNAIREDVELKLQGLRHNRSILEKGARLSGVLAFKNRLGDSDREYIEKQFSDSASGAENAGRVMISQGGDAEFVNMMMSARDMDWQTLTKVIDETVVARYNIPVTLFSVDAQTHNNYQTAWGLLYELAVLPTFQIVYSGLSRLFSDRLGEELEIHHDELSSSVLAERAIARAKDLARDQLITPNEARAMVGYEPVAGGDHILGPPGLVPQYEDVFPEYLSPPHERNRTASTQDQPRGPLN